MQPGLYIIVVPSGFDPFVLVGWLRPDANSAEYSDEFELLGGRVIRRFGAYAELGQMAANGPQEDTQLLAPTKRECYHRLSWGRAIPCEEAAWAPYCPKPENW